MRTDLARYVHVPRYMDIPLAMRTVYLVIPFWSNGTDLTHPYFKAAWHIPTPKALVWSVLILMARGLSSFSWPEVGSHSHPNHRDIVAMYI